MKKIGSRHIKLYDPIFKQEIHVFLNTPDKEYIRWQKRVGVEEVDRVSNTFLGFSSVLTSDEDPPMYLIYIRDFQWTIKNQGTLIHELAHTVVKLWDTNNIKFNQDTQEFYAHTIANLYEDIAVKLYTKK